MKTQVGLIVLGLITTILALESCTSGDTQAGKKVFSEEDAMSEIYSNINMTYCKTQGLTISSSTTDLSGYFYQIAPDWQGANLYFPELEQETWENFTAGNLLRNPLPSNLEFSGECPSTYNSCSETHIIQF